MTDLQTKNQIEYTFECLDSCSGYIDNLNMKIIKLSELYHCGEVDQANAIFAEVIEVLDLYIQLITKIYRNIRAFKKGHFQKSEEVQKLEIHLLSVMKAVLSAKESNDIIMLCDLLEFELIDNLTQWKIKVIPELKKTRSTL